MKRFLAVVCLALGGSLAGADPDIPEPPAKLLQRVEKPVKNDIGLEREKGPAQRLFAAPASAPADDGQLRVDRREKLIPSPPVAKPKSDRVDTELPRKLIPAREGGGG